MLFALQNDFDDGAVFDPEYAARAAPQIPRGFLLHHRAGHCPRNPAARRHLTAAPQRARTR